MANNDITYVRPEVRAAMPVWKKIRDVCKGADAVKAAGNEYLPFLDPSDKSARNKKRNADYIQRAVFYAITGNTKVGLLGLAFRKDPTMTAPDKLNYLRDNADGAGASIYQQSQQVTENILEAAREGLYTDYAAETDEAIILRYQAESIINWRTKRINGRDQLVLVVLRECMEKEDGFAYEDEIQYRELAPRTASLSAGCGESRPMQGLFLSILSITRSLKVRIFGMRSPLPLLAHKITIPASTSRL